MKRKIIAFSLLLLLIPSYQSIAITTNHTINSSKSAFNNSDFWAVLITAGEPKPDEKNARDLKNILVNHGWNNDNIYYLKENEATKEAILAVPDWLNDHGIKEEDLILFYFSMHGGRKEDVPPLDEPDNMDEFLIPYKPEKLNSNNILDEELALMFEQIISDNIVIIIESCFSGGMIDGTNDLKKSGRVIMTSAREDESSYPFFLKRSWLFPFYLIRGLRGLADKNCDGYISAEEAFKYAEIRTIKISTIFGYILYIFHRELFNQHPQLYDGWPLEENNEEELILINVS